MDPNANLDEQRRHVAYLLACNCDHAEHNQALCVQCQHRAERLVDLMEALDTWLTKGGAMPAAWTAASGVRA